MEPLDSFVRRETIAKLEQQLSLPALLTHICLTKEPKLSQNAYLVLPAKSVLPLVSLLLQKAVLLGNTVKMLHLKQTVRLVTNVLLALIFRSSVSLEQFKLQLANHHAYLVLLATTALSPLLTLIPTKQVYRLQSRSHAPKATSVLQEVTSIS